MNSKSTFGLSGQAVEVYKLLLKSLPLTSKEIAKSLKIFPRNIYRLTRELRLAGLVKQVDDYPLRYQAKRFDEAQDNYLLKQRNWLTGLFKESLLQSALATEAPFDISFIQSRDQNIEINIKDLNNAKYSVKYYILVVPIGIPAELMYANMQAVKRGVKVKIIAQEQNKENQSILMSYKSAGIDLRHGKSLGWHLFLFDDEISYITMFDPKNKVKQFGVRIAHKAINQQLQQIFDKYWNEAIDVE